MKILVADDTNLMRLMLRTWLAEFGYDVILANDGQDAVDKAIDSGVDIALVDWEMPKLTGAEACWRLRADERSRHMHLIIMTANDEPSRLIEALDSGADDFLRKPINRAELLARLRAATRLVSMRQEMMRLLITDPLTGLLNRRGFFERGLREVERCRRVGRPVSLMVVDIDHFKRVNDGHGHAAGDAVLSTFGRVCRETLSAENAAGRVGGEEFAAILPQTPGPKAVVVANQLRTAVAEAPFLYDGTNLHITVSLGVTQLAADDPNLEAAFQRADAALYRAKHDGRNRVVSADAFVAKA